MRQYDVSRTTVRQALNDFVNAGLSQIKKGAPALKMTGHVYDQNDIIFEYCVSYYRVYRYTFSTEIDRGKKDKSREVEKIFE